MAFFGIKFSNKSGIPSLLLFIFFGMSFNLFGYDFNNFEFIESLSSIALVVIMFYGGFGTRWSMAKPVFKEASVLSFFGVIITALLTGLFIHYVLGFSLLEGMLIGSIVGSTDYASVSNVLRSKNLNLKYNTAPLLEVESGSNDPTAFTLTFVFISLLKGEKINVGFFLLKQVLIGLLIGLIFSYITYKIIEKLDFNDDGLLTIFIIAIVTFTFSFTNLISGNGYLAIYVLGICIGNQFYKGKREVIFFFDGLTNIMEIGLFFLLGLLSNPKMIVENLLTSFFVAIFLMVIARPIAVYIFMKLFKKPLNQIAVVSFAGLRGAAAIAFAIMAINQGLALESDVFHIVFGVCLISSLVQGFLLPAFSKKMDMIDPNDTVLNTFNYYMDKTPIGFIKFKVEKSTNLINKKVKDLNLSFNVIVAKIIRDNKTIIPKGDTSFEENDIIIIGGESYFGDSNHDLKEFTVGPFHSWKGKKIKELDISKDILIVMLQDSEGNVVAPNGETLIKGGEKIITLEK